MKIITEAQLRAEFKRTLPETFCVPHGASLTPAAREYLQSHKVRIGQEAETPAPSAPERTAPVYAPTPAAPQYKYIDDATGGMLSEKPEYMTHIVGKRLVLKNHPRIALRGKLDSLQSDILIAQAECLEKPGYDWLVEALEEVLALVRQLVRCEVLEEPVPEYALLGLSQEQLHEQSHHPQQYFGIKAMSLPHCRMGLTCLRLNALRTKVREVELAAMDAFWINNRMTNPAFIEVLNRLSSAFYVLMCRCLQSEGKS